jgi:hypothetical protein
VSIAKKLSFFGFFVSCFSGSDDDDDDIVSRSPKDGAERFFFRWVTSELRLWTSPTSPSTLELLELESSALLELESSSLSSLSQPLSEEFELEQF